MTIYIHIGTHKTGTTSVQNYFKEHSSFFVRQHRLYYPCSGQISSGSHHNLVWEAAGDNRFEKRYGSWGDLANELMGSRSLFDDVFISCEAFSAYGDFKLMLDPLRGLAGKLNMTIRPIIFIRPQDDYIESLYFEDLKSGISDSFPRYVRKMLDNDRFNYFRVFRGWSDSSHLSPFVEIYRKGHDSLASIIRCLGLDGRGLSAGNLNRYSKRENTRLDASSLSLILAANRALRKSGANKDDLREKSYALVKAFADHGNNGKGTATVLTPELSKTIRDRFEPSNRKLAQALAITGDLFPPLMGDDRFDLERLLDDDTLDRIVVLLNELVRLQR